MSTATNLDNALALAANGYAVFPSVDKRPLLKGWQEAASTDAGIIRGWWQQWPNAVAAIPCGRNSLVVIDADVKDGKNGIANFRSWCEAHGVALDNVFSLYTPSGGAHVFWRDASGQIGNPPLLSDVDVRGSGGFVVAYGLVPAALQPLPEALATRLRNGKDSDKPTPVPVDLSAVTDSDRAYGHGALVKAAEQLSTVTSGRNPALNNAANAMGELIGNGSLDEQEVLAALRWACEVNGYTAKDGEQKRDATMFSGLSSGKARPRPLQSQSQLAKSGVALQQAMSSQIAKAAPQQKRQANLTRMDSLEPQSVEWLWNNWIPQGKLTIIAGEGGIGKSTIAYSFAATVSNGGLWPDSTRVRSAGNVLIWSSEDDTRDTILPRLIAMDADRSKIGAISGTTALDGSEVPFDPATDIDLLRERIDFIGGVSLIIIDPIVSAVAGDMHKANDTRRSLQPLVDLAEEMRCAVIGITHFAKNTGGKAVTERVIGSQAFTAFARATLIAKANDETGERVLVRPKMNNAPNKGGFHYSIEERYLQRWNIRTTGIKWGERIDGSAQEIVDSMEVKQAGKPSPKAEQAKEFIRSKLQHGPVKASVLFDEWEELGHGTRRTLQRAQEQLGITARKEGYPAEVVWSFPSFEIPWKPQDA